MKGLYIVFEGSDGSGKSTMSKAVYDHFRPEHGDRIIHTRHPGATSLGKELRTIIKHREDIQIDPLTERILFLADNSAFCFTQLAPALEEGKIVLADRSNFISDYAYGPPTGISESEIKKLHSLIAWKAPKIDLVLIYDCPWEIAKGRMFGDIVAGEQKKCRIEERGDDYFKKVIENYSKMSLHATGEFSSIVGSYANDIRHIDSTKPLVEVIEETISIVSTLM